MLILPQFTPNYSIISATTPAPTVRPPSRNKRGGEHYEVRIHKRLIDIVDPPGSTVDALMQLDLPAGVNIEIKLN